MNDSRWQPLCRLSDLEMNRGRAALIDGHQLAVFRLADDSVAVIDNCDPFSGANVMSRGVVGDRAGEAKVVSPIYKQSFSLRTGVCLDDESMSVATYPSRTHGDAVLIRLGGLG